MMRARYAGFTLIELLCAMALGLLVLAGTLAFTAQGREALRQREQRAQLLEQTRAALAFIETDLQMAGFFGLTNAGADFRFMQGGDLAGAGAASALSQDAARLAGVPAGAQSCGINYAIDLAVPLQAADGLFVTGISPNSSCAPRGGAVAGSDSLTIRRAQATASAPDASRVQLLIDRIDPARRLLIADGMLPAGVSLQAGLLEVHDLVTRLFYVANDSDGKPGLPALRAKTLTSVAGQPTFVDTEVMPGIEDLQVELLLPGGWVAARRPSAGDSVRAIRLTMRARGQDPASADVAHIAWTRTVLLQNAR